MIAQIDMPRRRALPVLDPANLAARGRDVTVKAIAVAVGLSQPAVSQVLNGTGRISAGTRERVLRTAEQMGYRPNAAARAIVTRKTRQVGVLVLNNPADPETYPQAYYTILGINMALESAGYVLCLIRIGDVDASVEGHSRVFREHVLDGVIVTTMLPDRVSKRIQTLVPVCVWADTHPWYANNCVRRDEVRVGRQAAEAILAAGYRRVIYLTEERNAGGLPPHYSSIERAKGIASVCRKAGLPMELVRHSWHWTPEFSDRLASMLVPDVAVVANDSFRARIVQQAAAVNKRLVGRDFGLVCCDISGDVPTTWPDLAGLPFDRIELGKRSAEMMLALLEGEEPKSLLLPSAFHAGDTLRRPGH